MIHLALLATLGALALPVQSQITTDLARLALPVTTAPVIVGCGFNDPDAEGTISVSTQGPQVIELDPFVCASVRRVERHRFHDQFLDIAGLRVLLHEAGHIAQWIESGGLTAFPEHDAECRSLAALPRALRTLGYGRRFIQATVRSQRDSILHDGAPYGGVC